MHFMLLHTNEYHQPIVLLGRSNFMFSFLVRVIYQNNIYVVQVCSDGQWGWGLHLKSRGGSSTLVHVDYVKILFSF